jgi:hypothetical protein
VLMAKRVGPAVVRPDAAPGTTGIPDAVLRP